MVRSTTSTKPIWVVGKGVGVGEGSVGSLAMAESTNEWLFGFTCWLYLVLQLAAAYGKPCAHKAH